LEKDGKLNGESETGMSGRSFLGGQLTKAGQMLGDLWYSAWEQAPIDTYLHTQLLRRKSGDDAASSQSSTGAPKSKGEH
jgi:hypothetical protein